MMVLWLYGRNIFVCKKYTLKYLKVLEHQFATSVQLLSYVQLFVIPWAIQSMEFSRPEYWNR